MSSRSFTFSCLVLVFICFRLRAALAVVLPTQGVHGQPATTSPRDRSPDLGPWPRGPIWSLGCPLLRRAVTLVLGEQAPGSVCLPAASLHPLSQRFSFTRFSPRTCPQCDSPGWAGALVWQVTCECTEASLPLDMEGRDGRRKAYAMLTHSGQELCPMASETGQWEGRGGQMRPALQQQRLWIPSNRLHLGQICVNYTKDNCTELQEGVALLKERNHTFPLFTIKMCEVEQWVFQFLSFQGLRFVFLMSRDEGSGCFKSITPGIFPKGTRASDVQAGPP